MADVPDFGMPPAAAANAKYGLAAKLCWAAVRLPYVVGGRGRLTGGMAVEVGGAAAPKPSRAAWKDKSLFLSSLTTGLTGMAGLAVVLGGRDDELTGVCHGLDLDFSLLDCEVDGEKRGLALGGAYVEGLALGGVVPLGVAVLGL